MNAQYYNLTTVPNLKANTMYKVRYLKLSVNS